MDFFVIKEKEERNGTTSVYPGWLYGSGIKDLLAPNGHFLAVWNEETGLWSTDESTVQELVDREIWAYTEKLREGGVRANAQLLADDTTGHWRKFMTYVQNFPGRHQDLNMKLVFADDTTKREDYATFKLPYNLVDGPCDAWDELVGVLYDPAERAKIEWAIGSVIAGDSVELQKFLVFYGKPGSGKSTILNIINKLFYGYTAIFNAKELTSTNNSFALAPFADNPLVALQQDGDLSQIEDNTLLNMITGHDEVIINMKYQQPFTLIPRALLFIASNSPVRIKNAKAGIIRRLIDVYPSGRRVDEQTFNQLISRIDFELGNIASHCLRRYLAMGRNYYDSYVPTKMQYETDYFYSYVEDHHYAFKAEDGITLKQAWEWYKEWCEGANVRAMSMVKFRAELENYFDEFSERKKVDGHDRRNYYSGYKGIMANIEEVEDVYEIDLVPYSGVSAFQAAYGDQPAQYAKDDGTPARKWDNVETTLKDLDPTRLHYVKIPSSHIVIDFDLVDEDGVKDLDRNLEEAARWPPTYTELSKSGNGVHLHYIYSGDVTELANVYDVGIEVKTLLGNQSLRRRMSMCNDIPIETISSGLPKKEKKVLDIRSVQTEKGLRDLIDRNLRKEIHPGTKPSVDFIHTILDEAYNDGLSFDVRDMRPKVLAFAAKSSNHSANCIKRVQEMRWVGKENMPPVEGDSDADIVFFDVEVYPNLFVVCWMRDGSNEVVRMINPTPHEVEPLLGQKLVGFNNRRYDNHILYARYMGSDNETLFKMSQKLISGNHNAYIGEAFGVSYADIYDFSSVKQGLKKFMIDLDIFHVEMDIPWDAPVDESLWEKVADYCANDVKATAAVFEARHSDFVARQILAEISGLTVNHPTKDHTARILFGEDKRAADKFVYTDLSELFPGYRFDNGESRYGDEVVGEGGYVYAEPGAYENVVALDVESMHPRSIIELNLFGPYTKNFEDLVEARLAIKHGEFDDARGMLDGKLKPFLEGAEDDDESAKALSYALKIIINIVYGLTSAKFDNPFRDPRNRDNIVAKRGALFMIDLRNAVQERGFQVVHIKTDSIKIPNPSDEIIEFVNEFGASYGYKFEVEAIYDRFCLVNDAVYVALENDHWTAVGAQFQHPYVYKKLFTDEDIAISDLYETKNVVKGAIYMAPPGVEDIEEFNFVGRTGMFLPVATDGNVLWRVNDGKKYAVSGTKGYKWVTRDVARQREIDGTLDFDWSYFDALLSKAEKTINEFTDVNDFVGRNDNE